MVDARVLGGRYEVESTLGKGGMAQVYLGTDRVLGRPVAVKVLDPQYARDESFVMRFRREAQAAAALNHPNVVGVFDTGSDDGTHFIVMEYVRGKTLAQVVREDAPLLPERAAEIAEAAAAALAFAHRHGIVHRDVKPANIMLTPTGDVKVMDFGIARATSSESLTQTATVLGTATYFSPEQAQGERVDARSDIYSLGCVLFELLTGHPPFTGDSPVAIAYKHVKEDPIPPSRLNPDVGAALDAVVLKCLAKNPDNRYASADELRAELARFRMGQPVTATPVIPLGETAAMGAPSRTQTLPATTVESAERSRRWVAVAILLFILAVLGVALFFLARTLLSSDDGLKPVPDVAGKRVSAATRLLEREGFTWRIARRRPSEDFPRDTVIDYSPKRAAVNDRIDLVVSTGPPIERVAVPNVICEPEDQAIQRLLEDGLRGRVAGQVSNPDCLPGEVGKTDPDPGIEVDEGSFVDLFLVPEPSPSPSPSPSPEPTEPSPEPTEPSPEPTEPSPEPTEPTPTITITVTSNGDDGGSE